MIKRLSFLPFLLRLALALVILTAGLSVWAMGMGRLRPRTELAFVDWTGLGVVDVSTGLIQRPVRLPGTYRLPTWSPDGRFLAFESNLSGQGTEIYVTNTDGAGGGLRQLTDHETDSHEPIWSPDSKQIAYTFDVSFAGQDNEIFVIDLDTGLSWNLTHNPANDYSPRWSPDGKQIVFLSNRDHLNPPAIAQEVYVMNADGSNPHRLTDVPADMTISSLAWSPDSQTMAFSQEDHRTEIPIVRLVDSRSGRAAFPSTAHFLGLQEMWAPDGQSIVFAWSTGIYIAQPGGMDRASLLTQAGNLFPVWSSDGRQIAFVSSDNAALGLYVIDSDGRNLRRLTTIGSAFPSWRP